MNIFINIFYLFYFFISFISLISLIRFFIKDLSYTYLYSYPNVYSLKFYNFFITINHIEIFKLGTRHLYGTILDFNLIINFLLFDLVQNIPRILQFIFSIIIYLYNIF